MRDVEKETKAHLLIILLNTRNGSHQKSSKQTERGDSSQNT